MLGYILTLITPPPADNVYGRYIEITLSIKSVPGTNQYWTMGVSDSRKQRKPVMRFELMSDRQPLFTSQTR